MCPIKFDRWEISSFLVSNSIIAICELCFIVILYGLVSELSSNFWWTPVVLDVYKICEVVFESVWLKARTVHQHLLKVTNLGFSLICLWTYELHWKVHKTRPWNQSELPFLPCAIVEIQSEGHSVTVYVMCWVSILVCLFSRPAAVM